MSVVGSVMRDYVRALKNSTLNARAFVVFTFLMSLYIGIYNVIFNLYVIKLGYTEQFLGLIISASMISTGLFAFPAAQCCDRMGSKMCLVTSGLLTAVTLYLLYTVTSMELLLALSLLNGIFGAIPTVIGHPFLVENSTQENRLHLFSINFGTIMAATIIGTSVGGYLPQLCQALFGLQEIGVDAYRYTLMISLAIAALSVVPLIFIKDRKKPCPVQSDMKAFVRKLAESKVVRQLVLISCLIGMGAGLIVPFFNVYFHKVLFATPGEIGIIFSIAQVSMVVGATIVPYIASRIGRVRMVALTYLCSVPFLLLLALTSNLYLAGAAYVLRMLFMNMSSPVSNSFSMEIVDSDDMASVSSLTSTGNYIAISIGSLIAGVMMSWGAYTMPYLSACVFYALASVLYFKFFHRHEEKASVQVQEVEVSV
ncbi:MFS transporter [Methanocella sp. MCL-LM]|uniref:MFS transporter n=1 Tax=Methanocella sp. MCL-LM TaxID=3412035 RepID=UPI003C7075E0